MMPTTATPPPIKESIFFHPFSLSYGAGKIKSAKLQKKQLHDNTLCITRYN